ncbi:MAG: hypothetical protein ACKO26_19785 [Planctomycetota bacterium]
MRRINTRPSRACLALASCVSSLPSHLTNDSRSFGAGCVADDGGISRAKTRSCTRTQTGVDRSVETDSSESFALAVAPSWQ